jgi:membrane-bound serine protease (ClpP class)
MTIAAILLSIGLLLIVAELMFPSFGALGLMASLFIVGSVAYAFAQDSDLGIGFMIAACVLVPAMVLIGFRLLPISPFSKHLVARGFTFEDGAAIDRRDGGLLGHEGRVDSLLRPAGTATIDGRRVDVVTRGEAIEAGTRVRVIEIEGNRVVVAAVESVASAPSNS